MKQSSSLLKLIFLNVVALFIIFLVGVTAIPTEVIAGDGGSPPINDTIPDTSIGVTSYIAEPETTQSENTTLSYLEIIWLTITL